MRQPTLAANSNPSTPGVGILLGIPANTPSLGIQCMPVIMRFLGYNTLPEANGWGKRVVRHRTTLGLTQKEAGTTSASYSDSNP